MPYKLVPTNEVPCILPAAVNLPNDPVEVDEPLTPPPTTVKLLELNSPRQEPLIDLFAIAPKTEFQVPAVIVPTEASLVADVILFCAAVPIVP